MTAALAPDRRAAFLPCRTVGGVTRARGADDSGLRINHPDEGSPARAGRTATWWTVLGFTWGHPRAPGGLRQ